MNNEITVKTWNNRPVWKGMEVTIEARGFGTFALGTAIGKKTAKDVAIYNLKKAALGKILNYNLDKIEAALSPANRKAIKDASNQQDPILSKLYSEILNIILAEPIK